MTGTNSTLSKPTITGTEARTARTPFGDVTTMLHVPTAFMEILALAMRDHTKRPPDVALELCIHDKNDIARLMGGILRTMEGEPGPISQVMMALPAAAEQFMGLMGR